MNTRNWIILATLFIAAFASWYVRQQEQPAPRERQTINRESSGAYLLDASIRGTDENGRTLYMIKAEEATQSDLGAPVFMQSVSIFYGDQNLPAWRIEASSAQLNESQSEVALSGNVIVLWAGDRKDQRMRMTTDTLTFDAVANRVSTDAGVRFDTGMGRLTATGMVASLENDTVQLKSNVRGQFKP